MKRFLLIMIILCLAVPFAFAGGGRDSGPASATANPNVTGNIMIYTSIYEDVIEAVQRVLDRQFPNANIEFFYGGTGQIQAKVAAEQASNRLGCDMLMVAEPAYSLELKEYGMLHPYISSEAQHLAFDFDREGFWYPVRLCVMVLAFNPDLHAKNAVPNSFRDFANSASVRGAISMGNPLTSGTTMAAVTALRDRYGYDYFDSLGRQGVMVESGSVALTKLETGECKVIMILEESVLKKREEEGSRLEVIYPTDGSILVPSTIMTVAERWSANRNLRAAEAITDWFLGHEGQNAIVDGWMHSVRSDFNRLPFDAIPTAQIRANNMPVIWENVFRQREEIRTRFEEFVTNRR